eukprot:TRINITY_DN7432_c0_g1_i1.p1 TRINITY_DN7432_c0_g1~~TRINITY_DN7432_c0_g1_i1.p1  ORF type:complete len:223 (+),score=60.82 TRINITY_DN7432_c0_g1_i1:55-669(+)
MSLCDLCYGNDAAASCPETVNLPKAAKYVDNLKVHCLKFDPTRSMAGISFERDNFYVAQTVSAASHKCVYCTEGFSEGSHFFSFNIIDRSSAGHIMIGASDGTASCTSSYYPGYNNCPGVSVYLSNGHRYYGNTNAALATSSQITKAEHIGLLLNMDHRTCTVFADGNIAGMIAGSDVLRAKKYFPVVALYELGHAVCSDKVAI